LVGLAVLQGEDSDLPSRWYQVPLWIANPLFGRIHVRMGPIVEGPNDPGQQAQSDEYFRNIRSPHRYSPNSDYRPFPGFKASAGAGLLPDRIVHSGDRSSYISPPPESGGFSNSEANRKNPGVAGTQGVSPVRQGEIE
jgi:hypothetical protein